MDGQMDRRMDGWADRWLAGWMDGLGAWDKATESLETHLRFKHPKKEPLHLLAQLHLSRRSFHFLRHLYLPPYK